MLRTNLAGMMKMKIEMKMKVEMFSSYPATYLVVDSRYYVLVDAVEVLHQKAVEEVMETALSYELGVFDQWFVTSSVADL